MNSMFGPETKFFKVTNQIGNILLVSVLWLIGCIPVITIGTSTIAMYYAMVKAVRCEEGYVTKEFFRSYRQNLKTGIVLTVIFPGLAAVLWLDHSYTVKQVSIVAGALEMVYLLLAFVIAGIVLYLFPVLSRFTMDVFSCFKLALFMVFKHLPTTILLLLLGCWCSACAVDPDPDDLCDAWSVLLFWKFPYGADLKKIYGKATEQRRGRKMVLPVSGFRRNSDGKRDYA